MKKGAKIGSTTTLKSTLERSGVSFLRFWVTFWGDRFSIDFRSIKSHPKINKTAGEDDQEDPCMIFEGGVGGRGGAQWGFGVWRFLRFARTGRVIPARRSQTCQRQGAADLSAPCGASTAAPSLCRSAVWCVRLLQLLAFCRTVNGCYASSLYRFLKVFGSSWLFVAVARRAAICKNMLWSNARNHQQYVRNHGRYGINQWSTKTKRKWVPKSMVNLWKLHQYHENETMGALGGLCVVSLRGKR